MLQPTPIKMSEISFKWKYVLKLCKLDLLYLNMFLLHDFSV